jgi:hypothetical protein
MSSIRNQAALPVAAACPRCNSPLRPLPDGRQACDVCKIAYRPQPPPVAAVADPNVRQLPPDDPEERRRRPAAVTFGWWFCQAVASVCAAFLFLSVHGGQVSAVQQGGLAAEMASYTVAAYVVARAAEALARR